MLRSIFIINWAKYILFFGMLAVSSAFANEGVVNVTSGSGFFVSPHHIITNAHVVKSCGAVYVSQWEKKNYQEAQVKIIDEASDLALIYTPLTTANVAILRTDGAVKRGDRVVVSGFPEKNGDIGGYTQTYGRVVNPSEPLFGKSILLLTDTVKSGNSGGPVLDEKGRVIGVASGRLKYFYTKTSTGNAAVTQQPEQTSAHKISGVAISLKTLNTFLERYASFIANEVKQRAVIPTQVTQEPKNYVVNIQCEEKDSRL